MEYSNIGFYCREQLLKDLESDKQRRLHIMFWLCTIFKLYTSKGIEKFILFQKFVTNLMHTFWGFFAHHMVISDVLYARTSTVSIFLRYGSLIFLCLYLELSKWFLLSFTLCLVFCLHEKRSKLILENMFF